MPPDPWKLLKTDDLTREQLRDLKKKLQEREDNLSAALEAVEQALVLVSRALSQSGISKYKRKVKRTLKRRKAKR
jgi:hypothetical protein